MDDWPTTSPIPDFKVGCAIGTFSCNKTQTVWFRNPYASRKASQDLKYTNLTVWDTKFQLQGSITYLGIEFYSTLSLVSHTQNTRTAFSLMMCVLYIFIIFVVNLMLSNII